MASEDGWRKKFDDPIVLPNGKTLVTLRDAVHHLAATVPKRERDHPAVLNAADHLTGPPSKATRCSSPARQRCKPSTVTGSACLIRPACP